MKKKLLVVVTVFLFTFTSCSNLVEIKDVKDGLKRSPREEAELYISNMLIWDNINMGRSITEKRDWPDFLCSLSIEDENGNSLCFNDFLEDEKKAFYEFWYKTEVDMLTESLETDEASIEYIKNENEIIDEVKRKVSRSASHKEQSEEFVNEYIKLLEKNAKKSVYMATNRSSGGGGTSLSKDDLNKDSVGKLANAYHKGYILIADKSSSSGTKVGYSGHAAIMHREAWDSNWNNRALEKISISAWGKGKPSWEGKKDDKVQEEPLVYWAGKASGCPKQVEVVRMRRKKWVWNWFKSGLRFIEASDTDINNAVDNANSWIGRDYAYLSLIAGISSEVLNPVAAPTTYTVAMIAKNSEKQFYCSQLVWRSWYKVSSEFDINPTKPCILPGDLRPQKSGGVTEFVASYSNY